MGTGTLSVCPHFLCKHYRLSQNLCGLFSRLSDLNINGEKQGELNAFKKLLGWRYLSYEPKDKRCTS